MADPTAPDDPTARPWTPAELRAHVQDAIELELFTIPAYLCAYTSIDQTRSDAAASAADAILTVVNQEMLHLEQVCNLSNALGQPPRLTGSAAPRYPGRVPYNRHDIEVALGPASAEQLRAFMAIELPLGRDPYARPDRPPQDRYETIGELYDAMIYGLEQVYGPDGEPWPTSALPQITGTFREDGVPITGVASAIKALELVMLQGEGASLADPHDGDPSELAHYYQFQALVNAIDPAALRPMIANAAGVTYGTRCARLLDFFDACYSDLLLRLEASFAGHAPIGAAVGLMYAVLGNLSLHVAGVPYQAAGEGEPSGQTLTPRFLYTTATPQQTFDQLDPADRGDPAVQSVAAALELGTAA